MKTKVLCHHTGLSGMWSVGQRCQMLQSTWRRGPGLRICGGSSRWWKWNLHLVCYLCVFMTIVFWCVVASAHSRCVLAWIILMCWFFTRCICWFTVQDAGLGQQYFMLKLWVNFATLLSFYRPSGPKISYAVLVQKAKLQPKYSQPLRQIVTCSHEHLCR